MDYEKDLEIDKYALDSECVNQPVRFMEWSKRWAEAIAERDRAEQKLKVIEAQVEQRIRMDGQSRSEKLTESAVKSLVMVDPEVQAAREEAIDSSYRANVLLAARQAMEQRKSMIEKLVNLFLSGYWADPKISNSDQQSLTQIGTEVQKDTLKRSPRLKKRAVMGDD